MPAAATAAPIDALPHAPGRLPVLGDVSSVDRKRPTQHEAMLAAQLGPIFQRKIFNDRLVVVAGARLATQCSDETRWARALVGPGAALRRLAPAGLFTARSSAPLWGQARRILTPGFTAAAMRTYHEAMQTVADDLITEWVAATEPVDAHSAATRTTLEVIARAGFSRDLGLFRACPDAAESHRFVTALAEVLRWASESTNELPIIGAVRNRLRDRTVRRAITVLHNLVDTLIADRRAVPTNNTDLLNLMLASVDPETERPLPDPNIRDQVLTFLIAGHETTAALLEVALYYLATDPLLQDRLRAEVRGRGGFDYAAVTGMRGLRQMLNECLRLWPPIPGYFRLARTDQELGGYHIPAGRAVFVLALAAHRDPTVWGNDADRFDPGRFDPDRLRDHPDRYFAPWGVGPRNCIGRAFALHEATLLLARILDACSLGDAPAQLTMTERGSLRPRPYRLTITPQTGHRTPGGEL